MPAGDADYEKEENIKYEKETLLKGLETVIKQLKKDYGHSRFKPIMENDIISYIQHLFWEHELAKISDVHMTTRVTGLQKEKIDLVIGEIVGKYKKPGAAAGKMSHLHWR